MKKTLLTIAFGLMTFGLSAQCPFSVDANNVSTGEGNESGVPVAPLSCVVNDGSNQSGMVISEFTAQPEDGYLYRLIISKPIIDPDGNLEGEIMGVSEDGSFDFSNDVATGLPFPADEYSFTSFIYKQEDLDVITELAKDNPITAPLGFVGGETLAEVITIVRTDPGKPIVELLNGGPVTVEDFLGNILPLIADVLVTDPLCVDWANGDEVYSIDVYDNADDCVSTGTSIENITSEDNIGIYPNPASTLTNIAFESDSYGEITLSLFDLTGKLIKTQNELVNTGSNQIPLSTDELQTGIYLLQVNAGTASITKRLTISK